MMFKVLLILVQSSRPCLFPSGKKKTYCFDSMTRCSLSYLLQYLPHNELHGSYRIMMSRGMCNCGTKNMHKVDKQVKHQSY